MRLLSSFQSGIAVPVGRDRERDLVRRDVPPCIEEAGESSWLPDGSVGAGVDDRRRELRLLVDLTEWTVFEPEATGSDTGCTAGVVERIRELRRGGFEG